jgi:drug/metabolite transporter (DMT)-like permease
MVWLIFPLITSAIWALINHFDKYLVDKYSNNRSIGSLIAFSGLVGLPLAVCIGFVNSDIYSLSFIEIAITVLSGAVYICSLIAYFQALEQDETSVVAPLFQLSTIISTILGYLVFGEILTRNQTVAGIMILVGSVGLTMGISEKNNKIYFKKRIFLLMLLSSFLISLNGVLFKYVAIEESFWASMFWMYIGYFVYTVSVMILVPKMRNDFFRVLKTNSIPIIGMNLANEMLATIGSLSFNFALILAPIGLVYFVSEGLQPFFVLLYGFILTVFFPKIAKEDISGNHVIQKVLAICLMAGGVYLISL